MTNEPRRPRRIAVICTRRLGDVLLTTALIRTLRRATQPGTQIHALVSPETVPALLGNPDLDAIIPVPPRPRWREAWDLLRRIFRKYDLAFATLISDRAHVLAFLAAAQRVTIVPPREQRGARWKRWLTWRAVKQSGSVHIVEQTLRLTDAIQLRRVASLVPPRPVEVAALELKLGAGWDASPFAVIHPAAMYPYKDWTTPGWRALVENLIGRGLRIFVTGGPGGRERALAAAVTEGFDGGRVTNLAGQLAFPELTPLIERARVFVGPDTSVTHLAAATGVATIALFGPSSPVLWGPWPRLPDGRTPATWKMTLPLQQQGNVWLLQGVPHCVPCFQEGCERHQQSRSACLDELPAARVIAVVDAVLRGN